MTIAGKPVSTLEGSGTIPGSYYLDTSMDNALKQPQLENQLRKAIKNNDEVKIRELDNELKVLVQRLLMMELLMVNTYPWNLNYKMS